jgi:sulfite oxidase
MKARIAAMRSLTDVKLPRRMAWRVMHGVGLVSVDAAAVGSRRRSRRLRARYAWYQWTFQTELEPGVHEIWSRAIDDLGRTQPLDGSVYWNPNGYEWTGVFQTEVTVS